MPLNQKALVIVVSQSGETADTLAALRLAKEKGLSLIHISVANDESFTVNDSSTELELLYIDDLVEGMFDLLEGCLLYTSRCV